MEESVHLLEQMFERIVLRKKCHDHRLIRDFMKYFLLRFDLTWFEILCINANYFHLPMEWHRKAWLTKEWLTKECLTTDGQYGPVCPYQRCYEFLNFLGLAIGETGVGDVCPGALSVPVHAGIHPLPPCGQNS